MKRSATTAGEPADAAAAPGDLAGLLRAHAAGRLADVAAVNLLIAHRHWLTRPAFTDRFVRPVTTVDGHRDRAWINWAAAVTALDRGQLPSSGSEANLLRIAASLGTGTPIVLRAVLGGLDRANIAAVTAAITAANGTHPE
ncbi:MAG TPA: hypothetical protein VGN54_03580 [Mycobacteriales bacterium]|jgi:hypothetical protein|nr:hypothetical protein [Mycobacteriales bacterium]